MNYVVIAAHRSEYPNPIELGSGELVNVGERYEGPEAGDEWYFCSSETHEGGWVPSELLQKQSDGSARVLEDYSARELDVHEGDRLSGARVLNGWVWCHASDGGDGGWVPTACLESEKADVPTDPKILPL